MLQHQSDAIVLQLFNNVTCNSPRILIRETDCTPTTMSNHGLCLYLKKRKVRKGKRHVASLYENRPTYTETIHLNVSPLLSFHLCFCCLLQICVLFPFFSSFFDKQSFQYWWLQLTKKRSNHLLSNFDIQFNYNYTTLDREKLHQKILM